MLLLGAAASSPAPAAGHLQCCSVIALIVFRQCKKLSIRIQVLNENYCKQYKLVYTGTWAAVQVAGEVFPYIVRQHLKINSQNATQKAKNAVCLL